MLVQLSVLVLCHTTLAALLQPVFDMSNLDLVNNLFEKFIVMYNRNYDTDEKIQRFEYFKVNLASINSLNERNPLAVFDINGFADYSPEETRTLTSCMKGWPVSTTCKTISDMPSRDAPDSVDWRDKKAVTLVKNQLTCGSCWAFGATGNVEGQYAIKYQQQVILSEQHLVDCDPKSGGCDGGLPTYAFEELIKEGGQELEADYPYENVQSECRFNKTKIAAKVTDCNVYNLNDEVMLKEAVFKIGPLTIGSPWMEAAQYRSSWHSKGEVYVQHWTCTGDDGVDATELLTYRGGILCTCLHDNLGHAVLLIGYGTDNETDFWIIKNSWGTVWGEQGFARVKRGNACLGIGKHVSSSVVG